MRFLSTTLLLLAGHIASAQFITPHAAEFSGGPKRSELKVEMIQIDLNTPCEIIMLVGVDRKGQVVSAKVEEGTGSCTDPDVVAKATASVRARVFNPAPDAPEVQYGRVHWSLSPIEENDPVVMQDNVEMLPEPAALETKVHACAAVEVAPQFPGGEAVMQKYMGKFLHYPEGAKAAKKEGVVAISFVVERDGMLSTITVEKGMEKSLDHEAMEFVRHMPKWQPGMHNGRQVRTRCMVPVTFQVK